MKVALSVPREVEVVTTVDATLYVDEDYPEGPAMFEGAEQIAWESDNERRILGDVFMRVAKRRLPISAKIGCVGAGTCYLPRLLNIRFRDENPGANTIDIYELEQDIVAWNNGTHGVHRHGWNFVVGDYNDTLLANPARAGYYDVLIHDIDADRDADNAALRTRVVDGGLFVNTYDLRHS